MPVTPIRSFSILTPSGLQFSSVSIPTRHKGKRGKATRSKVRLASSRKGDEAMKLQVPDMSCQHCVARITEAVEALDDAADLDFNLDTRTVEVDSNIAADEIVKTLGAAGFPAQPI